MEFTTKKILNNGRFILSTISGFLNAIICLIIQYFNAYIIARDIPQNNNKTTCSLKIESSAPAPPTITTTRTPSTFSSIFESSTLPPPTPTIMTTRIPTLSPPTITTTRIPTLSPPTITTTKKPSTFSSIFELSTLPAPPPPSLSPPTITTTETPSIFSSTFPPLLSPPPLITTTNTPSSILSSLFDSTPYSSPWMYSTSGDLIGTESGVFMASTCQELLELQQQLRNNKKPNDNIVVTKKKQPKNSKKEYPPTIPSWRGKFSGDLQWSLSRYYVDGRLILKEQTMEYYEYLEATQENGHLELNLVVLKGNTKCHDHQNDFDDTINDDITHDDTIDQGEKKKLIEEEIQKDFIMINGDIGLKKRRRENFSNEDEMTSKS